MKFPRRLRSLVVSASAATILLGILAVGVPTAAADEPVLHRVQYTVFSEVPYQGAEIYYRDVDPPNFAEYSHNPYVFSPKAKADVGPDQYWGLEVMLANPDEWALLSVSSKESLETSNFHCVIAVDGEVVVTNQGPKGALCSLRNW